jgi:hypothetical protein
MARDCSHIPSCQMYALLKLAGSLETWQARYCRADYTQCARYKLATEGRPVPINLMPNGAFLKTTGSIKE